MDISSYEGFRILADAIHEHSERAGRQLKEEAASLELRDYPAAETEIFRAKAKFFREFLEGQAASIFVSMENLKAAQLKKALRLPSS